MSDAAPGGGRRGDRIGALTGLAVALVVLGPLLRPGYVLVRDMVFVADWPLRGELLGLSAGLPRAVPSDAVVALLSQAIPGDVVQKLVLAAALAGATWGAARLSRAQHPASAVGAGLLYAWSAWVFERLMLGHWPLLLAYAVLPWAVDAAIEVREGRGSERRLLAWVVVAAIAGAPGLLLCVGPVAAVLLWGRPRATAPMIRVSAATLLASLPWAVPTLLHPGGVPSRPDGVAAFASAAHTPFGTLGSLLTLGGTWNRLAAPPERWTLLLGGLALLVAVVGLVGFLRFLGDKASSPAWRGLGVAGAAGLGLAMWTAVPGLDALAAELVGRVPGAGILRDAHKFVAPLGLVEAVGFAAVIDRLAARATDRTQATIIASGMAVLPLATLPGLMLGLGGRLEAVPYPPDWFEARDVMAADEATGDILVFPWTLYQVLPWNPQQAVLSPAQRFFDRRAILNDDLEVGDVTLVGEHPAAAIASDLATSDRPLAPELAAVGARYVLVLRDDAIAPERLAGLELAVDGPTLQLFRGTPAEPARLGQPPVLPVIVADLVALLGLAVLVARPVRSPVQSVTRQVRSATDDVGVT